MMILSVIYCSGYSDGLGLRILGSEHPIQPWKLIRVVELVTPFYSSLTYLESPVKMAESWFALVFI